MHYNARVMIVDRTGADSKLVAAVQSQGFDANRVSTSLS